MELSGIELRYLVNEIRSRVTSGYYVSGVNAITKSSLLLKLHHPTQEDIMLVLSARGVWITRLRFKPVEENSLESTAQKELERAKLDSIEQAGSERIVSMKFRHPDSRVRVVVCEFFGDGNLAICDESMQIITILNPIQVRHRTLGVGLRYAYPPSRGVDVFEVSLDEVLSSEILDIGRSSKTVELDRQIAVLEHDLDEQNKAKEAVMQKSFAIRKLADELMALSYHSPDDGKIHDALAANSALIVKEKGIKYVEVAGEQIEMQANLAKVSSMLFARAKEMERGNASIEEARAKLLAQIEKLRNQTAAIHKKVIVREQTAKEWYERYRWFLTTDGHLAIGGRDSSSNSALIRKHLTEDDIVFHAEVHGSPFFIVKNAAAPAQEGGIELSLLQVAKATVSFSRAWKDGLSSADAYWVKAEQVKKGAPTGQFLPKGSFVIEGKRNYLKGVEIRLAIGIVHLNGRETLVCGPEEAIKNRAMFYAVLLQGGMDPMTAAKKAKSEFVKISGESEIAETIKHMSLDDFVRALPTGQSRISFTARGQADK